METQVDVNHERAKVSTEEQKNKGREKEEESILKGKENTRLRALPPEVPSLPPYIHDGAPTSATACIGATASPRHKWVVASSDTPDAQSP